MPIFLDFTGFFEGVYISCREKHGFAVLYYTFLTIVTRKALPQAQHVLHYEAHYSDANPAAEAHQNGFATSFNQLYDIGVKADGAHGQHNEEFAQGLQRIKGFDSYTHVQSYSGDNGSQHKVDDEEGENTFDAIAVACRTSCKYIAIADSIISSSNSYPAVCKPVCSLPQPSPKKAPCVFCR